MCQANPKPYTGFCESPFALPEPADLPSILRGELVVDAGEQIAQAREHFEFVVDGQDAYRRDDGAARAE